MISRVQITQKMFERRTEKKKILLSKPVWQVFISDQLVAALPKAHENWIQVSLSHILVINRQACKFILSSILYSLRYKITLLLDGLVCSIAGYFYFSPVFWLEKYSMTRKDMLRYLRTKPSNKFLFLIFILPAHMFFGFFLSFAECPRGGLDFRTSSTRFLLSQLLKLTELMSRILYVNENFI